MGISKPKSSFFLSIRMVEKSWWYAAASTTQAALGIAFFKKGCGESGFSMPFKAFAVATLFVGAGATAAVGAVHATGIHSVDDAKEVGARIRRWSRVQPKETN